MSRVETLKDSRDSISVKFLEFTRIRCKSTNQIAIFFEGEDEKYFSGRINIIRPDIRWSGINSKGKSNVISLRNKIRKHSTYKDSPCLFFVDSDFDSNKEISNANDIYLTPCYSIENLYFSDTVFEKILAAEFGLSDTTDEHECYKKALELYVVTKKSYLQEIKYFNFLIRELRVMEQNGSIGGRLNINNLSIDDLISINLGYVTKQYDEKKPQQIFPELSSEIQISLQESENYFIELSADQWFRGKQHLEFLRVFLVKLKEDRCNTKSRTIFKSKGKVKLHLTKANSISELSQYAETPNCLKEFLVRQNFGKSAA